MSHNGGKRITEKALMWLVIVLSLALLTPWGIAQRHMLQPRLALVSVVLSTLAGAAFLVNAVLTVFSKRGGWRAAALPSCFAVSLFLLANTFVWGAKSSSAPLTGSGFGQVMATTPPGFTASNFLSVNIFF